MAETEHSHVVACAHCGESLYWHVCDRCELGYVGAAAPNCPICDDASLDDLSID